MLSRHGRDFVGNQKTGPREHPQPGLPSTTRRARQARAGADRLTVGPRTAILNER